jgi:diketogulonate reductase-like aldo/keto reductase
MNTDYFDLYLLHWREDVILADFVREIEEIRREGLIRHWGVSNFDMKDMADLLAIPGGENCFCNQILYNLMTRGPEYDLLPFLRENGIMPMAYSSLGSSFRSDKAVRDNPVIQKICRENGITHQALMLAFVTRHSDMPALFSTSSLDHLESNLAFAEFDIMPYMDQIDSEFPPPDHAEPLDKI